MIVKNGIETGPYDLHQLARMVQAGMVDVDNLSRVNGIAITK